MKKRKRKGAARPTKRRGARAAASPERSRRDVLRMARTWGLVAAGVGAGGWWMWSEVSAGIEEQDLGKIGNGVPTVVQIHDPTCPACAELQRQARRAVAAFQQGELQFVVASLNTSSGRRLAADHGVGHVTLVLFDGAGRRVDVLVGNRSRLELVDAFKARFPRLRARS